MIIIHLPSINIDFIYDQSDQISVEEILEQIKQDYKIEKQVKLWTCYSLERQAILNNNYAFHKSEQDELYIYFEVKNDFSDIQNQKILSIKQSIESQISTYRNSQFSEIRLNSTKIIHMDDLKQTIEIDAQTSTQELFEFLANQYKIQLKKIEQWSCFSEQRKKYLKREEKIGNIDQEILRINTNKDFLTRSSQDIRREDCSQNQFEKMERSNSQVFESYQCSKTITLTYSVLDNIKRKRTKVFLTTDKVEDIAQDILSFCALSIDKVSVDIFINGKQYNNYDKRNMTIEKINSNQELNIEARIRWIN